MDDDEPGSTGAAAIQAVAMLRAVIDGRTYESVAADFGITGGYDDGTFRPGGTLSRQGLAAFLHRYDALANPAT